MVVWILDAPREIRMAREGGRVRGGRELNQERGLTKLDVEGISVLAGRVGVRHRVAADE